jgi:hypothetical protein
MCGERVSGFGKMLSGDPGMNGAAAAIAEARNWAEELQKAEYRGLGDTREAARFRLSVRIGVPESYFKRLRYKWQEMNDISGSVYRSLLLAYEKLCESNEKAADGYRAERLGTGTQDATHQKPGQASMGVGSLAH